MDDRIGNKGHVHIDLKASATNLMENYAVGKAAEDYPMR